MAPSSISNATFVTDRFWTPKRLIIAAGSVLVGIAIFLFFAVIAGGIVTGEEFSPQTFCVRNFYYSRLPLLKLRVTGTQVDSLAGSLACSTTITSNMPGAISGKTRWDLIDYSVSGRTFPPGEATILIEYLRVRNSSGIFVWEQWSSDNKALATILWPVIQQLAIHQCYFAIPEIMQFALTRPTTTELSSLIAKVVHESALIRAKAFIADNQLLQAQALLDWAISVQPSESLAELRSSIAAPSKDSGSQTE